MNDQFSKIINQLKEKLTEKEKEKRNLDNQINCKDNEIKDAKQKLLFVKVKKIN